ncbi:hypothetical protein [Pseudarthrobacter chlorophenolicus]|nr:hypothetical protein [Pseudarthrobacter chlorophenolicus]
MKTPSLRTRVGSTRIWLLDHVPARTHYSALATRPLRPVMQRILA